MSSTVHAGSAPELLSLSPVPAPSPPVLVLDDRGGPPRVPASGTAETTVVVVRSEHGPCTTATLAALRSQTHPPDRVAVVVTGGAEADTADVAAARRAGVPVLGSRGGATGDAVRAGLAALDDDRLRPRPPTAGLDPTVGTGPTAGPGLTACPGPAAGLDPTAGTGPSARAGAPASTSGAWLWILPAGAVPAPDALATLLAAVEVAPSVAVAGPKLRDPAGNLVEAGLRTSRAGRPLTGVGADEPDQGQLDHRDDVLAVALTGVLVRRDVWDALGGPGEALRDGDGDDAAVDLCRRAWLAGHRVVVVPPAVVTVAAGQRPQGRSRHDRALLRLAGCPLPLLPLLAVALLGGALARAAALLVVGSPARAAAELTGPTAAMCRPVALLRARRARARTRRLPRRELRPLTATRQEVLAFHRERLDRLRGGAVERRTGPEGPLEASLTVPAPAAAPALGAGPGDDGAGQVGTGHDGTGHDGTGHDRTGGVAPVVAGATGVAPAGPAGDTPATTGAPAGRRTLAVLLAALTAASVLLLRPAWSAVTRGETFELGAQAAVPQGVSALWQAATSGWLPVGLGRAGVPDPLLAALAALSLPFGGSPPAAVALLLLGAAPLAALAAWWAAGALTASVAPRLGVAVVWALAAPLPAALATGRTGAVLAHLALPLAVRGLVSVARPGPSPAAARAGAASLAVAAVAAGAPVLLPLLAVAAVALALGPRPAGEASGGAQVRRRLLTAAVPLPGAALLLPLWLRLPEAPRVLLAEPGAAPSASGPPAGAEAAWDLAWLALAAVAVAALPALARGGRAGAVVRPAWLLALGGAVAVVAVVVLGGATDEATGGLPAAAGAPASVVLLGLLVAGLAAVSSPWSPGRSRRLAVAASAVLVPAVLAAPLAGAWAWSRSVDGPPAAALAPLPGVAADAAASPARARTLVLATTAPTGPTTGAEPARDVARGPGTGVVWALADTARPSATAASAWARLAPLPGDAPADPADDAVALAVAALASGSTDPGPALADLGVGYVLLRPEPSPALTPDVLDAAPGLTRAAGTAAGDLWRVEPADAAVPASRVRLLAGDGSAVAAVPAASPAGAPLAVDADVPGGAPGRLVVLAERADPGWTATLDGAPLDPAVHAGWAQAFRLPGSGGRLVVDHGDGAGPVDLARWLPLGLAAVAASPLLLHVGSRRREASA